MLSELLYFQANFAAFACLKYYTVTVLNRILFSPQKIKLNTQIYELRQDWVLKWKKKYTQPCYFL